jgi:hypothetical protein
MTSALWFKNNFDYLFHKNGSILNSTELYTEKLLDTIFFYLEILSGEWTLGKDKWKQGDGIALTQRKNNGDLD